MFVYSCLVPSRNGRPTRPRCSLGRRSRPGAGAPVEVIHNRIRDRNRSDPEWYLEAATELSRSMEEQPIEDHLVENGALSLAETAREVLRVTRWAEPTDPD